MSKKSQGNQPAKRAPGRPRKAANTALVAALIGRQDAMSRRTAGRIGAILDSHISVEQAAYATAQICRPARARMARLAADAAARLELGPPDARVLADLVREALSGLDALEAAFGPAPGATCPPAEPRPVARRSRCLASARAQSARLQTALMDLKARVTTLDRVRA